MVDGLFQSLMVFFLTYLLVQPANFNTESGLSVDDKLRMGVYILTPAVIVVNLYVLLNTYRWDYVMLGITAFSILLVWFWTGVWTSSTSSFQFYKAAAECYGSLSFWATLLLSVIICLLPRFFAKSYQKIFMPRDIDIIREQVRQHKFDYLNDLDPATLLIPHKKDTEILKEFSSSDEPGLSDVKRQQQYAADEHRPIVQPPSTAGGQTTTTRGPHSQQGSDDTMRSMGQGEQIPADANAFSNFPRFDRPQQAPSATFDPSQNLAPIVTNTSSVYTPYNPAESKGNSHLFSSASGRSSPRAPSPLDRPSPSWERPRPSFDRMRSSMDAIRPSFEQSRDMTTAAGLMKVESAHSGSKLVR